MEPLVPEDLLKGEMLYGAEGGDEFGVEVALPAKEAIDIFPVLDPLLLEGFDIRESHILYGLEHRLITALGKAELP